MIAKEESTTVKIASKRRLVALAAGSAAHQSDNLVIGKPLHEHEFDLLF